MTYGIGTLIPENADLNDYITPGIYYSTNTSHTSTLKNVPPTVGTGFRLEVKTTTSNNWVKQIVYPNTANQRTHMRQADGGTNMWGDWHYEIINADLIDGTDTRVAVKHAGGTNTRMVLDCTSPSEGYVSLEGVDGAWYRRLKFLSNGQIIYAYKATNGTEKTKVISEAPT